MSKTIQLGILTSHPIHYQLDLFRKLQKDGLTVKIYFCSDFGIRAGLDPTFSKVVQWYSPDILRDLPHAFLKNYSWKKTVGGFLSLINPEIIRILREDRPDALLIHGYMYLTNWLALLAAKQYGIPVIFRGESNLSRKRPFLISFVKNLVLRYFCRQIGAAAAIGQGNEKFYLSYGLEAKNIFQAPYAVDNLFFQNQTISETDKPRLRETLGLKPNAPVILFLSKLIARKRPMDLLLAYEKFCSTNPHISVQLLFLGDGPEQIKLAAYAKEKNLPEVHFAGFRPPSDLPQFFAIADIFALPSSFETWGLVVNEAMNFSLPIITTAAVGAAADLVRLENGFINSVGDTSAIAKNLEFLLQNPELRKKMGQASLKIINTWSLTETSRGIRAALNWVCRPRLIVAQPGSHHLWHAAVGLAKENWLVAYVTGIYLGPNSRLIKLLKFLPSRWETKIRKQLLRRFHPELNSVKIMTFGAWEWLTVFYGRLFRTQNPVWLWNIRNYFFSKKIGNLAIKHRAALWSGMSSSYEAFLTCEHQPVLKILDQFIGHPEKLNEILLAEVKKQPDLAGISKDFITEKRLQKSLQELALADCVVAGSNFVRQTLLDKGISDKKIAVIPYGVDINRFTPHTTPHTDSKFNLLFVGNLSVRKGVHYLLDAVQKINEPKIQLTLVGEMENSYFNKKLGPNCVWHPAVPNSEMPQIYRTADIFVFPSLFEGSALSIYEALASGLPVLTTENSGSVVRDGLEGFIIPPRNSDILRDQILLLFNNPSLRLKMSRAARTRAEEYTWENYSLRVAELAKNLLR